MRLKARNRAEFDVIRGQSESKIRRLFKYCTPFHYERAAHNSLQADDQRELPIVLHLSVRPTMIDQKTFLEQSDIIWVKSWFPSYAT